MSGPVQPSADDAVRDQASAWLVRVQSDAATAEDWAALTAWLEASEEHLAAFEAVEALSAEIAAHSADIARGIEPAAATVIAFPTRRRPARRWPVLAALGMTAAACLAVAPLLWGAYQGQQTIYRTGPGETRDLTLADGSHIRLDSSSQIKVRLGWRTRRVEMAEAEAAFDVAKDPGRPFVISVGDQQVRVVGTAFNIRHFDRSVVVTVRRGVVEVRQPSLGSLPVARLTPGYELRHIEGAPGSVRAQVDPAVAFAWTEGRLIYQDRPLSEVVADLNRRYALPIRVSEAAAGRRFSGMLELGDQAAVVKRLADYLSLSVDRTEREIILR